MSSTHFFDMQKLVRDLYQLQRENEVTHLNRILEKDAQMEKMKAYYESEMEKMKVYYESEMEKKETEMKETNMWFEHQLLEVRKIYYWEREKNSRLESDFEERTQEAELLHENMTKTLLGLQENIEAKEAKDKELHATREMALKKQIEVLQESERALQKEFERVYASEITKEVELLVASEKVEMLMASEIALKKEIEGDTKTIVELERIIEAMDAAFVSLIMRK
jgi:hypothetical protein